MNKELLNNMLDAYYIYNLNDNLDLPNIILKYLRDRIETNKNEIEKIISIFEIDIKIEQIIDIINDEINISPKSIGKTIIDKNGFMFAQVLVPIGLIAVRTYSSIEAIKYWVRAIKTRNVIVVSTKNYNEHSLESLILIIIKEALKKFNLNENLVSYISEEECQYELFDKVIYTYGKNGDIFQNLETQDISKLDKNAKKDYMYIEDESFKTEAQKNKDAIFLTGDIDDVISKIRNSNTAVIYTKDSNKAYKFINLVNANNVFVNTNIQNASDTLISEDELYRYKNIIIPIPKELLNKYNNIKEEKNIESINDQSSEDKMMIEYKESLWQKIKNKFKNLFKF